MKHFVLTLLIMTSSCLAHASAVEINPFGNWKVQVLLNNDKPDAFAYAVATHPPLPNGYQPGVSIHKLQLPAKFDELDEDQWTEVVLAERKESRSIDRKRLVGRGRNRRYIAEIRFDQRAETPTHATYMAFRINKDELLMFKFIAHREFYLPAQETVRRFMTSVRISTR